MSIEMLKTFPRYACHIRLALLICLVSSSVRAEDFVRVQFNNPGLVTDLGVGLWAWPMPMDWDSDGDLDLVVSCPDKPYNGTYFFENTEGNVKLPVFKPGVKVGPGMKNVQVSHVSGQPHVLMASKEFTNFLGKEFNTTKSVHSPERIHKNTGNLRFNVWSYVDYNNDGVQDILVGGDDWGYYGWDDGFDATGTWKRGPLHGFVYILPNEGTSDSPKYGQPVRLKAGDQEINVYGNPMPNMADFDGDGDLDLICAEFLDGFTYFENAGTRSEPDFATGKTLTRDGNKIHLHVQMITPSAIDWDHDGDVDLICGDEDGRVAFIENLGSVIDGQPAFANPVYFQQQATDLKFGALVTPVSIDWDADGDADLICGNTAGDIGFIENLDGGNPPKWANPVLLEADGKPIHIQAGKNGSIQGPAEAKWGYTTLSVADWNHDGLLDIVANSIWGKLVWFENVGTKTTARLKVEVPIVVAWKKAPPKPAWTWWTPQPGELVTQWRTTPLVVDWNHDGLNDLLSLDPEGYLAFYQRVKTEERLTLLPGERIFSGGKFDSKQKLLGDENGILQLNTGTNGASGRRKLCIVDWDGDGRQDIIINSVNANWLRNVYDQNGVTKLEDQGPLSQQTLAGHTTSPTIVDWDNDGIPELLLGAEDGRFYYLKNVTRNNK